MSERVFEPVTEVLEGVGFLACCEFALMDPVPSQHSSSNVHPTKNKTVQDTMTYLQKFVPPDQTPGIIHTDNFAGVHYGCEDLCWNHDKSTPKWNCRKRSSQGQRRYLCTSGAVGSFQKSGWEKKWNVSVVCETQKTNCQT